MKVSNTQLFEIVGITAVVLSLIFVAIQIQQSNRIAITTSEIEIRNNYAEINDSLFSDPDLASFLGKIMEGGTELLDERNRTGLTYPDGVRAYNWCLRLLNIWTAIYKANENGMVSQETYSSVIENITVDVGSAAPEMQKMWRRATSDYKNYVDPQVYEYIDELLRESGT